MKKWKCTVCGYIHTGDEPPENCPVCGADRSLFVEVVEAMVPVKAGAGPGPAGRAERWKCTVCGYKQDGTTPPDTCPVCGSDADLFEGIAADKEPITISAPPPHQRPSALSGQEKPKAQPRPTTAAAPAKGTLKERMILTGRLLLTQYHAHPISVHIPNGVLPVSVLFCMLASFFLCETLASAALYNMVAVVLAMPVVLLTGYNDWQQRFGGHLTSLFLTKIICGIIVLTATPILTVWLAVDSDLLLHASTGRRFFLLLALVAVGAAGVAGYMGGKLVFINRDDN